MLSSHKENAMRRLLPVILPVLILISTATLPCQVKPAQVSTVLLEHGRQRGDEYFWLNNPKESAVIQHLRAENAYTDTVMGHTRPLQEKIYEELVSRIEQRYESLPT